ncbi:hypothetical protein QBC34DRAFT_447132 [Podospora aff. communis PSN243]|uniref:Dihydrolipoyl dehydrogenase n=1 Tax=Podospora aff. communis PSN243 TaxID=3040156 RepID=A0AAV9GT68_9PEZI|nr:hypothetical protein QBC34DRAFT_447132 [Podospora aff. communis PSN243]
MPPKNGKGGGGPSLPLHLLKELGADSEGSAGRKKGRPELSRKDRRKAEREQKKRKVHQPVPSRANAKPAHASGRRKSEEEDDGELEGILLNDDDEIGDEDLVEDGSEGEEGGDDVFSSEDEEDHKQGPPSKAISKVVKDKLAQEDKEIAELERKLGLKGRKTLPQSFKDDGLGDLLEDLGGGYVDEKSQEKKKRKAEADEWLASKRRKASGQKGSEKEQDELDEGSDNDMGDLDGSDASGDSFGGFSENEDEEGDESEEEPQSQPKKPARENPYVAPVTGQQTTKYVPPSLRKETGSDAELVARIRRQTQGLVNRVTDSNLVSIIGEIEKLYRDHPRQHVSSALVDLLLIQVCEPTALPDTLLILNAGFATATYKVIGMDFGAQLVQEVAKGAATDLSNLYNFQLIGPKLVFDYIRMLLEDLSELTAELLLRIVRMSGPALRQDDPMALKDIVTLIRPAVTKIGEQNLSVRTKFMIDTIQDLKNNKKKTGVGASVIVSEHSTRMKKTLGSLNSKKLKSSEPLRIGLKDIQDSDEKGKWWLVGASWAGPSAGGKSSKEQAADDEESDEDSVIADLSDGPDIAELARQQMMNTDVRRALFVAITCAVDYEDAYVRINKLRLNKERRKEIPFVVMQCCGAEQHYNPYYTFVAKKVCSDARIKWGFQNGLWKLFKRFGETIFGEDADDMDDEEEVPLRRLVNNAKMFGTLVADGTLGLSILKCLNLPYLQKMTKAFVEVMLITVVQECQTNENAVEAAVSSVFRVESPELARGLQWFLRTVVRDSDLAGGRSETKRHKAACKIAEKDLVIIGGGVAGYVAAIKAGQEGMKVACIEKRGTLGGTCLNVGCIPSKSLLNNSHLYHQILHDSKHRGIEVGDVKLNLKQLMKAKEQSVSGLTKGVEFLFKKNGVEYIKGTGAFQDEHTIKVQLNDGGETSVRGKNILIATGSEATPFPGLEIDEQRVITSTGAIALEKVPEKLVVIGGGIIGLEMASVWSRLGSQVTVVEFLDQIGGPGMDLEIAKSAQKILKKQGINFKTGTKVISGDKSGELVKLEVDSAKGGKAETLEADVVLVAIGRRPYTGGLGLENIGLELDERGRVIIDSEYRTKLPHIRCVGDVTFGPMLAHKAEEEAVAVVEYMKKGYGHVNYGCIPSVMYTFPEVAWVGQSEQDLKKAGLKYRVGTFPFSANSRAKTNLDTDGMVKMLADPETDRLLGVHIIGPNAGEMIAEGTLALEYGASCEDIARTCHAHPTLAEAFKEAAMATYAKAIHF